MIYTLIHYRPDGSDYCRGCYMGGTCSDLEIATFDDHNAAARSIAEKLLWNETNTDRTYSDWETTILIDGYTENETPGWKTYNGEGPEPSHPYHALLETAQVSLGMLERELEEKHQRELEAKDIQAAIDKRKREEADERRERAELARLTEKYAQV